MPGLPIVEVVEGGDIEKEAFTDCDTGVMVNSGFLTGLSVEEGKEKITRWLEDKGLGKAKVNFKLRDWVFSRQRYWGEPIPIVLCDKCGYVPLPESELPLTLPMVESYEPTENGDSPLAAMTGWVNTVCPQTAPQKRTLCRSGPARRGISFATATCSTTGLASRGARYWTPVDWYNGGMEHHPHLLYSRFGTFLYDDYVPTANRTGSARATA